MKTISVVILILILNAKENNGSNLNDCLYQGSNTFWDLSTGSSIEKTEYGFVFTSDSTLSEYEYVSDCLRDYRKYAKDLKKVAHSFKWEVNNGELKIGYRYNYKVKYYSKDTLVVYDYLDSTESNKYVYIKSNDQIDNLGKNRCLKIEW